MGDTGKVKGPITGKHALTVGYRGEQTKCETKEPEAAAKKGILLLGRP